MGGAVGGVAGVGVDTARPWRVAVLGCLTLWEREVVRFARQRNRVVGAMATPFVFWLLLGAGLDRSFTVAGAGVGDLEAGSRVGYMAYFFPGTVVLVVLFTAIFSTISVIEDRREGFLQSVLVSPVPGWSIALGKVLGGATIAGLQGLVFLAMWPLVGWWPGWWAMAGAAGVMVLLGVGLTGLGLCFAWPMDSTAGFHAVMNLVLMPMWFLSGAVFPLSGAPGWMRVVMWANPLTYGHAAFSSLLTGGRLGGDGVVSAGVAVGVTGVFAVVVVWLASLKVSAGRGAG